MPEFIVGAVSGALAAGLWIGSGIFAWLVMEFHAECALDAILGPSRIRTIVSWILWPATLIAVLLLQLNRRYRGSKRDAIP